MIAPVSSLNVNRFESLPAVIDPVMFSPSASLADIVATVVPTLTFSASDTSLVLDISGEWLFSTVRYM